MHANTLEEQQRTKSHGQLYEQIWSSNNNNQQTGVPNRYSQPQRQPMPNSNSVDELNMKNLDLASGPTFNQANPNVLIEKNLNQMNHIQQQQQQQQYGKQKFDSIDNNNMRGNKASQPLASDSSTLLTSSSRSNILPQQHQQQQFAKTNGHRIIQRGGNDEVQDLNRNRNYENQLVNHLNHQQQQQQQQQQRNFIMSTQSKPCIPNKPFNINMGSVSQSRIMSQQNNNNNMDAFGEEDLVHSAPQMSTVLAMASTAKVVHNKLNGSSSVQTASKWEHEQLHRLTKDDETRFDLLRQRIELLQQLEAKPQGFRTNEEENRLNKLRTEIEFDKRVIEMNHANLGSYMNAANEDEDEQEDFAPEVRDRINAQMRIEHLQRRQKLDDINQLQQTTSLSNLVERESHKSEEQRLKKHVEPAAGRPQQAYSTYNNGFHSSANDVNEQHYNGDVQTDTEIVITQTVKPKKNVQFVCEAEVMSPKFCSPPSSQQSSTSNLKASPPDQHVDSPQQQTPQKRVMFSENNMNMGLDFESHDSNENGNEMMPNTPCVIGANEIYVDQRLKQKQEQQLQMANMIVEGEKLSFKDKMKLFAKQSGDNMLHDADNKFKVSKKQREIESKFDTK